MPDVRLQRHGVAAHLALVRETARAPRVQSLRQDVHDPSKAEAGKGETMTGLHGHYDVVLPIECRSCGARWQYRHRTMVRTYPPGQNDRLELAVLPGRLRCDDCGDCQGFPVEEHAQAASA